MRPIQRPECSELIEPTDIVCNYCRTEIDDGARSFEYPDGRKVDIHADGTVSVEFPNGRTSTIAVNGAMTWKLRNGRTSKILTTGAMISEFADGRISKVFANGGVSTKDGQLRKMKINFDGHVDSEIFPGMKISGNPRNSFHVCFLGGQEIIIRSDGTVSWLNPLTGLYLD